MNQDELESQFLSGVVQSTDNIVILLTQHADNFINYLTSKELKFMFSLVLSTYETYSDLLTEKLLENSLVERGAEEEDILKYKYLLKQLKKVKINETDFKFISTKLTDSYVSRCLIDTLLQTQEVLQRDKNGIEAFDLLEKNLMILKSQIVDKDIREASTRNITEEVKLYEDMKAHPERYAGIKIGIDKLDDMTGGFRNGELVIILGAPGAGKSLFLMNAQYNMIMNGRSSLYVTIEMALEQARRRLVSRITEIPYLRIKNMRLDDEELTRMKEMLGEFEKKPGQSLIIDVPERCTPKMIEAKIRMQMKKEKIDVVIMDYLLLMSPSLPGFKGSREEKITQVALELKQMARSLNIPVITASQITSKAGEDRDKTTDEAYDWTEISQAKSMAAHADWVLSLKKEPDANLLNLGITKGRDGMIEGVVPMVTDFAKMKIGNIKDVSESNPNEVKVSDQLKSEDKF